MFFNPGDHWWLRAASLLLFVVVALSIVLGGQMLWVVLGVVFVFLVAAAYATSTDRL